MGAVAPKTNLSAGSTS